jgi:hypothetical protein
MSRTGDALEALFAALAAKAAEPDAAIPAPLQNEALPARLTEATEGLKRHLNVWDSGEDTPDEFLGADVVASGYELTWSVPIEFVVTRGERPARRAAFEAGARCDLGSDRGGSHARRHRQPRRNAHAPAHRLGSDHRPPERTRGRDHGAAELRLLKIVLRFEQWTNWTIRATKPRSLPSHVVLLVDWGRHPAGRVLAADADLVGHLDVEGVKYRAATEFGRRLGGFVQ